MQYYYFRHISWHLLLSPRTVPGWAFSETQAEQYLCPASQQAFVREALLRA